jgi:2-(1,2-epoxy-1,2-dihydrophenyl)acetyl-CoA isomerase
VDGQAPAAIYEVEGAVATITLNRPEQMNTMAGGLVEAVTRGLERASDDESVRAVILTGAGRAFCAGGDLRGMAAGDGAEPAAGDGADPAAGDAQAGDRTERHAGVDGAVARLRIAMRTSQLLRDMPKVTLAAINGACAGAGLAWAAACDIRYCAASAKFNTAFMTAGLSGDFGGTWTLPRIVGPAKARELYLLAEKFRAAEAERIGLVSAVVPDGELMGEVRRVAERVAGFAPLTMRAIKANLNDALALGFSEQLDREAERHIRCGLTEDAREAAMAFLEKRTPRFVGR